MDDIYEPNIVVIEVGDYVRYNVLDKDKFDKSVNFSEMDNYSIVECVLYFDLNSNFLANSKNNRNSNDYYIIDGNDKISPLNLKVGDRLYFDYDNSKVLTTRTTSAFVATTTQPYLTTGPGPENAGSESTPDISQYKHYGTALINFRGDKLYLCK